MDWPVPWFAIVSYGVATLVYGGMALVLLLGQPINRRASLSTAAMIGSSLWAAVVTVALLRGPPATALVVGLDAAHLFLWTLCVLSWLRTALTNVALLGLSALAGLWAIGVSLPFGSPSLLEPTAYPAVVVMSLIALLAVDQVIRHAHEGQRQSLLLLSVAIGAIAIVDLFVYSQAVLFDGFVPFFWEARGLANAALLPLIVRGLRQQADWQQELSVSRQVVFYTASLFGVGGYLLVMGVVAYVIRALGNSWSPFFEFVFLAIAVAVLIYVLFSSSIRARFRALLVKHFYKNKYDYRREWLRLTQSLGRSGDLRVLAERGLEALARIAGSRWGHLWISRDAGRYDCMATIGAHEPPSWTYDAKHPLVEFLATRSWVIDSTEYAREPERYQSAFGRPEEAQLPGDAIIVPLDLQGFLQGFVILAKPATTGALNFEDHDILKTAGKQVAVVLAQSLALEKLAETRQFEAISKMATFLVHDLKNIIAQQQLVVSNAARFRHRPEFMDDAMMTIRSGVERMRHVLDQLKDSRLLTAVGGRTDVSKVLIEVRSHCADRAPVPTVASSDTAMWVRIDRAKLVSVLTHLVRNAQDATPAEGSVRLEAQVVGAEVICRVVDTGSGMDPVFIRDRLFRPFDSTKGVHGMGIGAYQVRDTVRAAGGDMEVTSKPGEGTTVRLRLPLADAVPLAAAAE